jgi:hypothetical protein
MPGALIYQPHNHLARSFFVHPDIFRNLVEFYLTPQLVDDLDLDSFHPI